MTTDTPTIEIPRGDWRTYFDNFSRHLPALEATVEFEDKDLGAQIIAQNMLLTGLTYDDRDDVFVIGLAREGEEVFEHMIARPQQIIVATIDVLESVEIKDAEERQTIVSLRPAPDLPPPE